MSLELDRSNKVVSEGAKTSAMREQKDVNASTCINAYIRTNAHVRHPLTILIVRDSLAGMPWLCDTIRSHEKP